jgi:hypothetical protein
MEYTSSASSSPLVRPVCCVKQHTRRGRSQSSDRAPHHKRVPRLPTTMNGMLKNDYPGLSRREFLTTAVGAGGAILLGPAWLHASDTADPRIAQVMSRTIGVDMHNHGRPRLVGNECAYVS